MSSALRTVSARIGTLLVGCAILVSIPSCNKHNEETSDGASSTDNLVPEPPEVAVIETPRLTLGIVANTHAAPIVVGHTQGMFKDQQLEVTPQLSQDYDTILAGILSGQLDGGMLPPGLVLSAVADDAQKRLLVPSVLSRNGSSIVIGQEIWQALANELLTDAHGDPIVPITSDALGLVAQAASSTGNPLIFGVESAHSSANYLLRYWLAAGGIYPRAKDALVEIKPTHPLLSQATVDIVTAATSEIIAGLGDRSIAGTANSEPTARGASASHQIAITGYDILKNHPSAVFAVSSDWAAQNGPALQAVIRALHEAAQWLDASLENRRQASQDAAAITGADPSTFRDALTNALNLANQQPQAFPDYQVFARYQATAPDPVHALWTLTQLVRWGQIAGDRSDAWFAQTVAQIYRPDLYHSALGNKASATAQTAILTDFIDGGEFNASTPNAYLEESRIGLH